MFLLLRLTTLLFVSAHFKESDGFLLLIYRRSFDKLETWLYFLPVWDVLKLCIDGFLNDSFAIWKSTQTCQSSLCVPFVSYVAPNSASSWPRNWGSDWASAIWKPHLRKRHFLGRTRSQRINFKLECKYDSNNSLGAGCRNWVLAPCLENTDRHGQ